MILLRLKLAKMSGKPAVKLNFSFNNLAPGEAKFYGIVDGDTFDMLIIGELIGQYFVFQGADGKWYKIESTRMYIDHVSSHPNVYRVRIRLIGVNSKETKGPHPAKGPMDLELANVATERLPVDMKEFVQNNDGVVLALYGLEVPHNNRGNLRIVGDLKSGNKSLTAKLKKRIYKGQHLWDSPDGKYEADSITKF